MALIKPEEVKDMRKAIKARFPTPLYKFSITTRNYSTVCVQLMEGPDNLGEDGKHSTINHRALDALKSTVEKDFWEDILDIILSIKPCEDRSEPLAGYHEVDYYIDFGYGKYNKPYTVVSEN